jgi:bifunctional non-homologous end joining protein LigD
MALEDYKRKRDFNKTPEPAGEKVVKKKKGEELFFCGQKHLASHLHYDFRLEWNGVLLSWAVPKGPSLDPTDKRLAMHVEDHPVEYGTFEGVIPEGYGAGVVMLWDQGTWMPEVDDVDAALARGDLKFTLDGYKLKGSWVLVRTKGYGGQGARGGSDGKSAWLLIKHRDEWAGPIDIATFAPKSVKSGGSFRDILMTEVPDVWHSNRHAPGKEGFASLKRIVEKVLALEEDSQSEVAPAPPPATETTVKSARKAARPAARRETRAATPPRSARTRPTPDAAERGATARRRSAKR